MAKETPLQHGLDTRPDRLEGIPGPTSTLSDTAEPAASAEVIDVLNTLLEAIRDGDYGFATAAGYTDSPRLKPLLGRRAEECRAAAQELQALIVRLGGQAAEGGSAVGALHRGWVSVRGTVSHYSDEAMLKEWARGEDAEMAAYIHALTSNLPPGERSVVERQALAVRRSRAEVQAMLESLTPSPH
jgi:uncharacterized protein (TIGR02284 family)